MNYVFRTLIVPAALAGQVRALCVSLAGDAAAGMFTTPLSASGKAPATHHISTGAVGSEFADALASPEAMFLVCQAAELPVTLAQCEAIHAACEIVDLDDETAHDTLARLGLQLVRGDV